MSEWCLAHPWMTFFIAATLASGFRFRIRIGKQEP